MINRSVMCALLLCASLSAQAMVTTGSIAVSDVRSITTDNDKTIVMTSHGIGVFETKSLTISKSIISGKNLNACDGSTVPHDCSMLGWEFDIVVINGIPKRCRIEYYGCNTGYGYKVICQL